MVSRKEAPRRARLTGNLARNNGGSVMTITEHLIDLEGNLEVVLSWYRSFHAHVSWDDGDFGWALSRALSHTKTMRELVRACCVDDGGDEPAPIEGK